MTIIHRIRILGSGCSSGVPRIDGYWGACDPNEVKNRRTRCSLSVQQFQAFSAKDLTQIVIDTSPDFRQQCLDAKINRLDALFWTHDHADQTHGIDDLRFLAYAMGDTIPAYMDQTCYQALFHRFPYIFQGAHGYEPLCDPRIVKVKDEIVTIGGPGGKLRVSTFEQIHGPITSVGYRIGDMAYSSDVSDLPEDSFDALKGLKLWIVDALRHKPHPNPCAFS